MLGLLQGRKILSDTLSPAELETAYVGKLAPVISPEELAAAADKVRHE